MVVMLELFSPLIHAAPRRAAFMAKAYASMSQFLLKSFSIAANHFNSTSNRTSLHHPSIINKFSPLFSKFTSRT
jgi:hypothetical protein